MTCFAWALFKSSPERPGVQNQAMEVLLASREINPSLDLTHLYLGYVYQAQGKERQSGKSFELAVQANPDCIEALRELRLINLRREQAPQSKGLFKKFMKRND
jgi:tetratricopeptide (TPR) repeat protein